MSSIILHQDEFGHPINEGIKKIYRYNLDVSSTKTNFSIPLPSYEIYQVIIKEGDATLKMQVKINDWDALTFKTGDAVSNIADYVKSIVVTTSATSATQFEIWFIE